VEKLLIAEFQALRA